MSGTGLWSSLQSFIQIDTVIRFNEKVITSKLIQKTPKNMKNSLVVLGQENNIDLNFIKPYWSDYNKNNHYPTYMIKKICVQ